MRTWAPLMPSPSPRAGSESTALAAPEVCEVLLLLAGHADDSLVAAACAVLGNATRSASARGEADAQADPA
jgi:hypothetical protein